MAKTNLQTGNYGESLACEFLRKKGYEIIERNFRIRGGEIDIIAMDGEYRIFVEVKTRNSYEYGLPVESITPWKINALLRAAQFYNQKTDWGNRPYRLDFVSVDLIDPDKPVLELIRNITE